jgi:ADP-ribose pyrophosphatase
VYVSPGYVAERMTVYIATGLTRGEPRPMEDERIECHWFAPSEIDLMIRSGRLIDAKTIAAFLAWQRYR